MDIRAIMALVCALSVGMVSAGSIKKWVDADGNVHFGDAPPAEAATERVEVKPASDIPRRSSPDNYYSPQNQLKRMEGGRSSAPRHRDVVRQQEVQLRRKERTLAKEGEEAKRSAKCDYHKARVKEYEHKVIQPYETEGGRLRDKSHLEFLKMKVVDYCG